MTYLEQIDKVIARQDATSAALGLEPVTTIALTVYRDRPEDDGSA